MSNLSIKALDIARGEMGKCEKPKGSNWGQDVQKYLASVNIGSPNAWCMAFVYWCTDQAAKALATPNPLFKTGGCLLQAQKSAKLITAKPQPGDIFIMDFGHGKGHTGFVDRVEAGRIYTVEGNSNDEGSREGYEVCAKPGGRAISSIKCFLRV